MDSVIRTDLAVRVGGCYRIAFRTDDGEPHDVLGRVPGCGALAKLDRMLAI